MSVKIGELLKMFELEHMEVDMNRSDTYHNVKCKFKDTVIVPVAAISNNIDFLIYTDAKKHVRTSDDKECLVVKYEEIHICDLECDVKSIYGIDTWSFVKTWHKHEPCMTSMNFIKMELRDESRTDG